MDGLTDALSGININQSSADMFKTKMEVDTLNKSIKQDGKEQVKNLGKDEFLKLLITELKYQDPTNPMQDREFIAQMAQFSSLEQMLNFNTGMQKLLQNVSFQSSFNLIGQNVDVDVKDEVDQNGNSIIASGVVESVAKRGADTMIRVNGEEYSADDILRVY